jgi:hypothetical protein
MGALQFGQLLAAVDAQHLPLGGRVAGDDLFAFGGGHADHVGEVVLALGILVGEPRQPAGQLAGGQAEDAGVHLVDGQLLGAGVLVLDDALHLAPRVAHDAAVAGGLARRTVSRAMTPSRAMRVISWRVSGRVRGTSP